MEEHVQDAQVVPAVVQEIDVLMPLRRGMDPAGLVEHQGGAVVDDRKAVFAHKAFAQLHRPVRFAPYLRLVLRVTVVHIPHGVIQGGGGAFQVSHALETPVPVEPGPALAKIRVSDHLDVQGIGREGPILLAGHDEVARGDLDGTPLIRHPELGHRKAAVQHGLGLLIHERPRGAVFDADHPLGQNGDPVFLAGHHGLFVRGGVRISSVLHIHRAFPSARFCFLTKVYFRLLCFDSRE